MLQSSAQDQTLDPEPTFLLSFLHCLAVLSLLASSRRQFPNTLLKQELLSQNPCLQKQSLDMVNDDMSLGRLKSCLQNITSKTVVGIIIVNTEAYFEKCLFPSSIYVI